MPKPWENNSGCSDYTAYNAINDIQDEDKRLARLVYVLKYIIDSSGYDLAERIVLRDRRTGRVHR